MSQRDLPVRRGLTIPGVEIREAASRSGGPGGQHVNKTNTRVSLRWNARKSGAPTALQRRRLLRRLAGRLTRAGDLVVHASRHRSRSRNRELARERLAELVRDATASPRKRVPSAPSKAARQRRVQDKRHRSQVKRTRGRIRED
ncbi:MAG: alternative ribosome rescue aminoacyl-tRNA hydrolase ArfB [Myxococcota bacterium]|nr:alternative ribosome rescue aminoacyl-tRNA hydrolase ArfB [Myxococcota bacterium]